ncbi:hypothetical protein CI238_10721 [Colletotrichum incanum]|uniref:Uncharacterized protein n=1 Tax=Colletotrichum incanum TaxID=1573173 RepID=A0A167CKH5_COLIC|nr:hypothetical protein CI238_10721 [Colletotrichum incanum]
MDIFATKASSIPRVGNLLHRLRVVCLITLLFYRLNIQTHQNRKYGPKTRRKRANANSNFEAELSDTIHVASTCGDIFIPYSGIESSRKPTTRRGALSVRASSSAKRMRLHVAEEPSLTSPRSCAEWDDFEATAVDGLPQHPSTGTQEHNSETVGVLMSTAADQYSVDSSIGVDSGNVNEHAFLPSFEAGGSAFRNQSSTLAADTIHVFTGAPFANMDVDPETVRNVRSSVEEVQETPSPARLPTTGGRLAGAEPMRSGTELDGVLQPQSESKVQVRFRYSVLVHYPKHLRKTWKPRGSFAEKSLSMVAEELEQELVDGIPLQDEAPRIEGWRFAVRGCDAHFRYEVGREGEDEFREMKRQMMGDIASSIQGPSDRTNSWEIDIEILRDRDPTVRMNVGDIDFKW